MYSPFRHQRRRQRKSNEPPCLKFYADEYLQNEKEKLSTSKKLELPSVADWSFVSLIKYESLRTRVD